MEYSLAKELKDAGFLQNGKSNEYFVGPTIYNPGGVSTSDMSRFYKPTLEELIEACGTAFASLDYSSGIFSQRTENNLAWVANGFITGRITQCVADTPTEAVARLWIALNTKQKVI